MKELHLWTPRADLLPTDWRRQRREEEQNHIWTPSADLQNHIEQNKYYHQKIEEGKKITYVLNLITVSIYWIDHCPNILVKLTGFWVFIKVEKHQRWWIILLKFMKSITEAQRLTHQFHLLVIYMGRRSLRLVWFTKKASLWRTTTAGSTFFLRSGFPFFTVAITMSATHADGRRRVDALCFRRMRERENAIERGVRSWPCMLPGLPDGGAARRRRRCRLCVSREGREWIGGRRRKKEKKVESGGREGREWIGGKKRNKRKWRVVGEKGEKGERKERKESFLVSHRYLCIHFTQISVRAYYTRMSVTNKMYYTQKSVKKLLHTDICEE